MSATRHCHLQNQKALVTGATFGIGRAIAIHLASEGAEVIVHGRDTARGVGTVEAISAAGGLARFVAADLSRSSRDPHLAEDVGDIDILVNNAAISVWRSTADLRRRRASTPCSPATSVHRTSSLPHLRRGWPPGAAAASST